MYGHKTHYMMATVHPLVSYADMKKLVKFLSGVGMVGFKQAMVGEFADAGNQGTWQ